MDYLIPLKAMFESNADPGRAAPMKAYMRNLSDFYGLSSPLRKELFKEFLGKNGLPEKEQLAELVWYTWSQPQREWQYFGMEVIERFARKGDESLIPLAEFMITNKSWWDTVDYIAPNIVGAIMKKKKYLILPLTGKWMNSENLWLQRSCLLFQLKYRDETDKALLFRFCEELSGHPDFFIRKAIGWSLREYSKRNPEAVREFVGLQKMSPLSKKEALRRIT